MNNRLLSLDFYRGLTMFILIGEVTHLYEYMADSNSSILAWIGRQFFHHSWHGLLPWDLVEPFFMFIVGVALPFAVAARLKRGATRKQITVHVFKRSLILFVLGIWLYSISAGVVVFELWNVLTQLAFTYIIAYSIMQKTIKTQLFISFGFLLLTDLLYRFWPVVGFNQLLPAQNFGSWMDLFLMGKLDAEHWVAINVLPTTAFTIWGVVAGLVLRSDRTDMKKIRVLMIAGLIGVIAGYALDPVIPIIKKICTVSFMLVGGGWSVIALALSFWLVDVRKIQKIPKIFVVVGMNSLFIYIFAQVGGADIINYMVKPLSMSLLGWAGVAPAETVTAAITWAALWYLCYWMYKRKIFIKI